MTSGVPKATTHGIASRNASSDGLPEWTWASRGRSDFTCMVPSGPPQVELYVHDAGPFRAARRLHHAETVRGCPAEVVAHDGIRFAERNAHAAEPPAGVHELPAAPCGSPVPSASHASRSRSSAGTLATPPGSGCAVQCGRSTSPRFDIRLTTLPAVSGMPDLFHELNHAHADLARPSPSSSPTVRNRCLKKLSGELRKSRVIEKVLRLPIVDLLRCVRRRG